MKSWRITLGACMLVVATWIGGCIEEDDDCSRRETCTTDSGTFDPGTLDTGDSQ